MRMPTTSLCSTLALATALVFPSAAGAQVLGTGVSVNGSASIDNSGGVPGDPNFPITKVTVNQPQAVINWTATGQVVNGQQVFLPAGTTLEFRGGGAAGSDYAVLNRIMPDGTAKIALNGTIRSLVNQNSQGNGDPSQGNAQSPGGTIYFYSPYGLILGSTARIDVGRLGLTTADPWSGSGTDWYTNNQVLFGQGAATIANSSVQINAGAQINAMIDNRPGASYVALVAPIISHAGSISTSGQAALVAAEQATITFSPNGLFDIQVAVGSGGGPGPEITSTGSITGPAATNPEIANRIYIVAVPKNDAITMALGAGSLGFEVAGAANVVGNAIVLSAGYNIDDGVAESAPAAAAGASASIELGSPVVTSALFATAIDKITWGVTGGAASVPSAVTLTAGNEIEIFADDGTLTTAGALSLTADILSVNARNSGTVTINGALTLTGEEIAVGAETAGTVDIKGALTATAPKVALSAASGGLVDIDGNFTANASRDGASTLR